MKRKEVEQKREEDKNKWQNFNSSLVGLIALCSVRHLPHSIAHPSPNHHNNPDPT